MWSIRAAARRRPASSRPEHHLLVHAQPRELLLRVLEHVGRAPREVGGRQVGRGVAAPGEPRHRAGAGARPGAWPASTCPSRWCRRGPPARPASRAKSTPRTTPRRRRRRTRGRGRRGRRARGQRRVRGLRAVAPTSSSGSQAPAATSFARDRARTSAGRPDVDRPAVRPEREHAVGDRPRDVDPVLHEDDRRPPVPRAARRAARRTRRAAGGSRLAVGSSSTRMPGSRRQRARQGEPLLLAAREPRRASPLEPAQADLAERLGDPGAHRRAVPAPALEPERDVVLDPLHHELALGVLEHEADPGRHLGPGRRRRVEPSTVSRPRHSPGELARHEARERERERALARPRRPDDEQALARLDRRTRRPRTPKTGRLANRKASPSARIAPGRPTAGSAVSWEPLQHAGLAQRRARAARSRRRR